ncbi:hypothetical protein GCM10027404_03510 [Arthrobacter tumbae]
MLGAPPVPMISREVNGIPSIIKVSAFKVVVGSMSSSLYGGNEFDVVTGSQFPARPLTARNDRCVDCHGHTEP